MTENRPVQASVGDEVSNGNQEKHPGLQVTETIAARPSSSPSSLDTQQEGPNDTEQRVPEGAIQASGESSTCSIKVLAEDDPRYAECLPLLVSDQVPTSKHPEYKGEQARLRSLDSFPTVNATAVGDEGPLTSTSLGLATAGHLATAGFYFTGIGDRVCCFYCGGTMASRELTDKNIRHTHARDYIGCANTSLAKGAGFAKRIFQAAGDTTKDAARDVYMSREAADLVLVPELVHYIDDVLHQSDLDLIPESDDDHMKLKCTELNIHNPKNDVASCDLFTEME